MPVIPYGKTNYTNSTPFDWQDLNSIGNCFLQIGYGLTPATVTVDGNQNTISNLGLLSGATVKATSKFQLRGADDGTTLRNIIEFQRSSDGIVQHRICSDPANSNQLVIKGNVSGGVNSTVKIDSPLTVTGNTSFSGVVSFTGNTTIAGNLGIGTVSPATQSHLQASASVVESRLENTAAATCTIMQSLKTATQQWETSLARGGSQDRSFVVYDRSNSKIRVELTQDGIIKTFAGTNTKDTTFELVMADGTSVNLTSYCGGGSYGILQVATGLSATCGSVFLKGGFNTVQELQDASNSISITDTAGQLCFLSAGSGQFNVKNRLGTTATISFRFVGQ